MLRFLFALALLGATALIPLEAQVYTIQPRSMTVNNKPRGGFSICFRSGGAAKVTFEDVGVIASKFDIGDTTTSALRLYDDGSVSFDTRAGATGPGSDDGRTNTWEYRYPAQHVGDDIAMHQYSVASNGTSVTADSGKMSGVDMQYDMVLGVAGSAVTERSWTFSWGLMAGATFSPINAKTRAQIKANLVTVTDLYSLEGADVPDAPYSAPSTTTIDGETPSGDPTSYTIDNTVLLDSRPYSRSAPTITADGATIDGFWQVKGAYYQFRVGPWARWQLTRFMSLHASVGGTFSFLGVNMEYDELASGFDATTALRGGATSTPDKNERFGVYAALDAEFWLSDRTGFFAGLSYENNGKDFVLRSSDTSGGDRNAVVQVPHGASLRAGISVLF